MRYHRSFRLDRNHPEIVAAFEAGGCAVQSLAIVGGGCPDLLVWRPLEGSMGLGILTLVEVKDGSKPPSARRLTDKEQAWRAAWPGPVHVIESVQDVADLLRVRGDL